MARFLEDLDLSGNAIENVKAGASPNSAVSKQQLDDAIAAAGSWADEVTIVATAPVDVATGGLLTTMEITPDPRWPNQPVLFDAGLSVPLREGQVVLLTAQADKTQNRAYAASAGPWVPVDAELVAGDRVQVKESVFAGQTYILKTEGPIVPGTTPLDWRLVDLSDLSPSRSYIDMGGNKIVNLRPGNNDEEAASYGQVRGAIDAVATLQQQPLNLFTPPDGDLNLNAFKLIAVADGVDPTDGVNRGQLDAAIAGATVDLSTHSLSELAVPTADLDAGGFSLINLADAVAPTSPVTKRQLDSAQMGIDWKGSVRVVATSDVALSGLQTIDGQDLEDGDLVLAVAQTDPTASNGYIVRAGAWEIAPQFTDGNLSSGAYVPVEFSSSTPGVKYRLATPDPIQVGTTDLDWQIADVATTYVGDGQTIDVTGGVISAITTKLARKMEGTLGDGALTLIPITHNFGTQAVISQVWDVGTGETVNCGMLRTDANTMTFRFATAPAAAAYGFAIQG